MDIRNQYGTVMVELKNIVDIDKKRKVCKDCGLPGHNNKRQLVCHVKIKADKEKKNKIQNYIMDIDCLEDNDDSEMFERLATELGVTVNSCKSLYSEISPEVWINRKMDINKYIDNLHKCCCMTCSNVILEFSKNRIWRDKIVCDYCWDSCRGERDIMWAEISEYKKLECCICNKIKTCVGDRFHYDHLNMFYKNDSICCMVDKGEKMEDIFSEIDKCQILCLPCHHIVTAIEQKCGFTRIKSTLTRKYNNEDISEEKYNEEKKKYQNIYELKMKSIYEELKNKYINEHRR